MATVISAAVAVVGLVFCAAGLDEVTRLSGSRPVGFMLILLGLGCLTLAFFMTRGV